MEENKNISFEDFLSFVKEEQRKSKDKLDKKLLENLLKTAKVFDEVKENDEERQQVVNALRERFKDKDLNQVTELFIYCQSQLSTNEEPVPTPSILCISIGKIYDKKHLDYVATKIYVGNQIESSCALIYLVYLALHDKHRDYIFDFIKDNFEGFSHNNKTDCVFHLKDLFPDHEIAQQIVEESGITEHKLIFSTESDPSSKPITFQMDNNSSTSTEKAAVEEHKVKENINKYKASKSHKKWWQFWK